MFDKMKEDLQVLSCFSAPSLEMACRLLFSEVQIEHLSHLLSSIREVAIDQEKKTLHVKIVKSGYSSTHLNQLMNTVSCFPEEAVRFAACLEKNEAGK